jgi:seryl-tRNA(Sec) selenium transferase
LVDQLVRATSSEDLVAHTSTYTTKAPLLKNFAMRTNIVKVAAVQAAPVAFDLAKSIEKVENFTAEAAQSGADLVVFP